MKKFFAIAMALAMMLSLAACSEGGATTAPAPAPALTDINEIYEATVNGVEMPEMIALDAELMLDLCGIEQANYKQGVVYICSNSLQADEIWVLEATNADAMAALKTQAQARLDQKNAESITYSPEQNAVVKAAQVIQIGDFLVMLVSPQVETLAGNLRTAMGQ